MKACLLGETFSLDNSIKIKMKDKNLIDGKGDLQRHSIMSTHIPYDDDSKLKSQFFIYDKSLNKRVIPEQLSDDYIPWSQISSLSSLLLFNSSVNAYTFSNHSDKLLGKAQQSSRIRKPKSDQVDGSTDSGSVHQDSNLEEDITFKISFDSAPQFLDDLPVALPSLPGIAVEFNFVDGGDSDGYLGW
ncbi:Alpha-tubulin binding [Blomia tropicalis]|nr:Alpha-tubulin binding [Blomia tropicalis]